MTDLRRLTTTAELDALPVGSVVLGDDSKPWQKKHAGWETVGRYVAFPPTAAGLLPAVPLTTEALAGPAVAAFSAAFQKVTAVSVAAQLEQAVIRLQMLRAWDTDHLAALAEMVEAGVQPSQMRLLARALASQLDAATTEVRRNG